MQICKWLGVSAAIVPVGRRWTQAELNLMSAAGNYIMVNPGKLPPFSNRALYTGIAQNLGERLGPSHEKWSRAGGLGMSQLHLIPIADADVSRDLETVLRYVLQPPLQDQPRPMHLTAAQAARRIGFDQIAGEAEAASFADNAFARERRALPALRPQNAFAVGLSLGPPKRDH